MNDGQRAQKALQLEKEREIMKEIFKEKRYKIRKDNRISINTDKFVRESDDLNKKLAKDTVGLVHLNQFQKIREDILNEDLDGQVRKRELEEQERKRKRLKEANSKLSFKLEEDDEAFEEVEAEAEETVKRKGRLGADPSVKSYFEASDYVAATSAALETSTDLHNQEKRVRDERRKAQSVRLTLSYYDGADHRFCVDFRRGDLLREVLRKCQQEYGPLRGILVDNLLLIKENLILPTESLSVFDLEEAEALKDGGRGPYHNSDLFSFTPQAKDQKAAIVSDGTAPAPLNPDEMIETDASRNAKICTKSWFERNKHLAPAKYWYRYDPLKHCRKNNNNK
jgi:protein FAM50